MSAAASIPGSTRANKPAPARAPLHSTRNANRVLVVEDLEAVRRLAKNIFEDAGLTVTTATNATEALTILEQAPETVDLLFTDYIMPGMSGIDLIDRVAARWPGIRLVLSSGFLAETPHKEFQKRKITLLRKPYDMRHAAEIIVQLLSQES